MGLTEAGPSARKAQSVNTAIVVGLPRSGTTLLAYLLSGGDKAVSLSEPFLSRAACRNRFLNPLYFPRIGKYRITPPAYCDEIGFLNYLKDFSRDRGFLSLIIKETYRLSPYLENIALLDRIAANGDPLAVITRHPYDAAVSTIRWARHQLRGAPGLLNRIMVPGFPDFSGDLQVVEWFAQNWLSFSRWIRGRKNFTVRYEELVRDPGPCLRELCEYCNVPFAEKMLDNKQPHVFIGMSGDPGGHSRHKKKLLVRPVGSRDQLKTEFIDIIKSVCGEAAEEMGYSL